MDFFDPAKKLPGYFVSESGKILDPDNKKSRVFTDSLGYKFIKIPGYKKYVNVYVHQIVAETFIPNPNNYSLINHKDGNKANNNVSNLEWVDDHIPKLPTEMWHKILSQIPLTISYFLIDKHLCYIITKHIYAERYKKFAITRYIYLYHKYIKFTQSEFFKFRDISCNSLSNIVEELVVGGGKCISDFGLKLLTKVQNLTLINATRITNRSVSTLKNLNTLSLIYNSLIKDLSKLTSLTSLYLVNNTTITSRGIKNLTQLKRLVLNKSNNIQNDALQKLTNLTELDLTFNNKITNGGISALTSLKTLSLRNTVSITDISMLTNLLSLNLRENDSINGDQLTLLTNLTSLSISFYPFIRDYHFLYLTNLTELDVGFDDEFVTSREILQLKKLKLLKLHKTNNYIDLNELTCIKSLVIDIKS